MATSGNFLTSDSGQGGNGYYSRMIFEWWQTGSGVSGSVGYHNISYHLKTWDGSTTRYQYFFQGSMNVDGAGYSWGTTQAYGGGATVFGDYGKTLYTDSAGNRGFGASAQGGIYNNTINTSGSGSWGLDNIPLHAVLTGLSMDGGGIPFTDEGGAWVEFNNPAGTQVDAFIDDPSGRAVTASNVGSRYNFNFDSALTNHLQASSPNSNTFSINFGIIDYIGGATYDYRQRTGYIKNDLGQANPVFSNFTFADANAASAALTGNNQILIQGQSDLQVTVPVANAASPRKYATMDHYNITIGGYSNNLAYSSSATITKDVGAVSDINGTQTISVNAVDSRGNSKVVTKPVTIIPYGFPSIQPTATRVNGYDDALILKINGAVSPVTVSGTDKNIVNTTTGLQYRFTQDGADITGVAWTNVPNTQTTGTGAVAATNQSIIIAAQGIASSQHSFKIQVRITDTFYTTTNTINIPAGIPIMRIGTDGVVYFKEVAYNSYNSTTSSSTPAPNGFAVLNRYVISALATAATIGSPLGATWTDNNRIVMRIKDNGTAQGLTWHAVYRGVGVTLPTATVAGKNQYIGCVYNVWDAKWDVIAYSVEA